MVDRNTLLAAGLAGLSSVLDSSSEDEDQTLEAQDRLYPTSQAPQPNALRSTIPEFFMPFILHSISLN
jgi:hypothetical protein